MTIRFFTRKNTVFPSSWHTTKQRINWYRRVLHMAAYALKPGAQVGRILRCQMGLLYKLAQQIELFSWTTVNKLDAPYASWIDADAKCVDFRSIA